MTTDGSVFAPFRHKQFAWLWTANALSALGTFIQVTATSWLMTDLAPDPFMVSLVQAASQLPFVLLVLPAGALADIVDRRRYLILTNASMLASAAALAMLAAFGLLTAWNLLGLTVLLAALTALNAPAWASSVPLMVPRQDLQQALVLNAVGYNLARAIGPAAGGLMVAGAGVAMAFAANAASYGVVAAVTAAAIVFPRRDADGIPPERFTRATRLGVRYTFAEPVVRSALLRSVAFYAFAGALWALLPLYVRQVLELSATGYGLMLGAIGTGAVIGGIAMPRLRRRFSREQFLRLAGLLTGASMALVAVVPRAEIAALAMVAYGVGWIIGAANLQATVQLASAPWVRARTLALYQGAFAGGLGFGAVAWGLLAEYLGTSGTLLAAGSGSIVTAAVLRRAVLPDEVPDPSRAPAHPTPRIQVDDDLLGELETRRAPVLVTIAYDIGKDNIGAFRDAMRELSSARQRGGAVAWVLCRDVESPETWVEAFRLPDWTELRRGMARVNFVDSTAADRARALHRGPNPPRVRVLLADSWPST